MFKILLKSYIFFLGKKNYIIKASLFSLPKASHGIELALVLVVKEFLVMLRKKLLLRKFGVIPLRCGITIKDWFSRWDRKI